MNSIWGGHLGLTNPRNTPSEVARWSGNEWRAVGTRESGKVSALVSWEGDLYAGGATRSGDEGMIEIAKWDGRRWSDLDAGVNQGGVNALTVWNGSLYAGGSFTQIGETQALRIAKWDGNAWSALGLGLDGEVSALAVWEGQLYVGGGFTMAGGRQASGIARWDGVNWESVGSGVNDGEVNVLLASDSFLYAGGSFEQAGGESAHGIARWDGTAWHPLGSGVGDWSHFGVTSLALLDNELYAGGDFLTAGGKASAYLARIFLDGVPSLELMQERATVYFRDLPAGRYQIERSPGLDNWSALRTCTIADTGGMDFVDNTRPLDNAFYRAVRIADPPPSPEPDPLPPRPILYSEDFESGAEGWETIASAGETHWEHGAPNSPKLTAAHSGKHVYGTDLDAPYTNDVVASLRSPLIDLSDAVRPRLSFWYFVDTTFMVDGVQLRILDEKGILIWKNEVEDNFWGTTEEWTEFNMPIPSEASDRKIKLEWLLLSDDSEPNGDGFFLDDVVVD
jgi:hypothetical protein